MKKFNWNYPTSMWVGENRIKDLSIACKNLNVKKPLFVTDKGLAQSTIVKDALSHLKSNNLSAELFHDVIGNPTGKNVSDGVKHYKEKNCDGVIAFGGGSGLDVGKAIAFMIGQTLSLWDFEDVGDNWTKANPNNIAPIIAVPTTAGTGSETGRASVFTNEQTQEKKIIFHPKMLPSIVILDPNLTIPLPSNLTAFTGMDALAHCLEAYLSNIFHPYSQGIALEGIRLVKNNLVHAFNNGSNLEARSHMLASSSMGSIAFQKGLGAIHSLSHPVGAIYNTHHGLTNAVFMPYVLQYNKKGIEEKIIDISRYINLKSATFNNFMDWILELRSNLNIPHTLSEIIDDDKNLEKMSLMAFNDPSTTTNPIPVNAEDFLKMYINAFKGDL